MVPQRGFEPPAQELDFVGTLWRYCGVYVSISATFSNPVDETSDGSTGIARI
jgi:hypothetical protein